MNRYEQVIHMDMNWTDEQTEEERLARNNDAKLAAELVAATVRNPSKGVHTEAYETLTGWAVLVTHNVMTIGQSDLKQACVDRGYEWHRNCVTAGPSIEKWLTENGMPADEASRLVEKARRTNPDVLVDR